MNDQAAPLRKLVNQSGRAATTVAPRMVLVLGGKGGVGTTTLAVNLAVLLAQQGHRGVLVDANPLRGDVASLCQLPERHTIADVLAARRDIHEILERGPAGLQVVPGIWGSTVRENANPSGWDRLATQLQSLGRHADWVLVDGGAGPNALARRLGQKASDLVLVTTSDPLAVTNAYASFKTLALESLALRRVWLLVNRVAGPDEAPEVYGRFLLVCRRFLGRNVELLGGIPRHEEGANRSGGNLPQVWQAPRGAVAAACQSAVATLLGSEAPNTCRAA